MSPLTRGWLVFAAMIAAAFIAVEFTATFLQNYETHSEDQNKTNALHGN